MASPCQHDGETLATVMLFRDSSKPFETATAESLEAISPMLGEYLSRVIRVHHRMDTEPVSGSDDDPGNSWDVNDDELPF